MNYLTITKNLEKKFDTKLVISFVANINLGVNYNEIFDLCSFISNETVTSDSFFLGKTNILLIKSLICEQYPKLKDIVFDPEVVTHKLNSTDKEYITKIIEQCNEIFGKKIVLKSVKKCVIYKKQDKDIKKLKLTR